MALVLGTNCGLVAVAPTTDPVGTQLGLDRIARALKVTVPAGVTTITEIGWWCDIAYAFDSNFEVGLYSHDAENDLPNARLYVDATNARGTAAGWKPVTVEWTVVPETIYWIAVELDDTVTAIYTDYSSDVGERHTRYAPATSLTNPWTAGTPTDDEVIAIYALMAGVLIYSELSGTVEGVGTPSGNLEIATISELSGTIAGVGAMSGNLGSVLVNISSDINYKRLVVAGSNGFYYEDI